MGGRGNGAMGAGRELSGGGGKRGGGMVVGRDII